MHGCWGSHTIYILGTGRGTGRGKSDIESRLSIHSIYSGFALRRKERSREDIIIPCQDCAHGIGILSRCIYIYQFSFRYSLIHLFRSFISCCAVCLFLCYIIRVYIYCRNTPPKASHTSVKTSSYGQSDGLQPGHISILSRACIHHRYTDIHKYTCPSKYL